MEKFPLPYRQVSLRTATLQSTGAEPVMHEDELAEQEHQLAEQEHQREIARLRQKAKHQRELAVIKAEIEAENKLHALTLQLHNHKFSQEIARQQVQLDEAYAKLCEEEEVRAAQKAQAQIAKDAEFARNLLPEFIPQAQPRDAAPVKRHDAAAGNPREHDVRRHFVQPGVVVRPENIIYPAPSIIPPNKMIVPEIVKELDYLVGLLLKHDPFPGDPRVAEQRQRICARVKALRAQHAKFYRS